MLELVKSQQYSGVLYKIDKTFTETFTSFSSHTNPSTHSSKMSLNQFYLSPCHRIVNNQLLNKSWQSTIFSLNFCLWCSQILWNHGWKNLHCLKNKMNLTKIKQQMVQLLNSAKLWFHPHSAGTIFPGWGMIYGANIRSRWKTTQQIILMRSAIKTVSERFFMKSLIQQPQQSSLLGKRHNEQARTLFKITSHKMFMCQARNEKLF